MMKRALAVAGFVSMVSMPHTIAGQQSSADTTQAHCAAAKAIAGTEHMNLYNRFAEVCDPAEAAAATAARRGGAAPGRGGAPQPPARAVWYHEPVKVFDNLYFVGTNEHSSWAVQTSEGLIVIDALFDYAVRDEVVEGLRKLGVNPATMKYLIISHGHADHHGGAKFLQDEFAPRLVMGREDWDLVEQNKTTPIPKRDMIATDGQKITLGDTTLTLYATPGHTAGTFSIIIPVKDHGKPHLLATWGGTAVGRASSPDAIKAYINSAARYRELLGKLGVEGIVSNHTAYDNSLKKLEALKTRTPAEPHPYLTGVESVRRYLSVAEELGRAALALPRP
jgi:metallo-beta-lactamase class B